MKWVRKWWGSVPTKAFTDGPPADLPPLPALGLSASIVETLQRACERKAPCETGGVLVGHVDGDGRTVVTAVVGPGPNALHSRNRFQRDGEYTQAEVDRLYHESEGRVDYIGEWHSHPDAGGPSHIDRHAMSWISDDPRYSSREPLLIIMERVRRREWQLRAYRWVQQRLVEVKSSALSVP